MKEVKNYITPKKFWSSLHHVDYKFVIIPVVFVFLRIWTGIMNILYLYIKIDEKPTLHVPQELNQALLYLSVSSHKLELLIFIRFCFDCTQMHINYDHLYYYRMHGQQNKSIPSSLLYCTQWSRNRGGRGGPLAPPPNTSERGPAPRPQ